MGFPLLSHTAPESEPPRSEPGCGILNGINVMVNWRTNKIRGHSPMFVLWWKDEVWCWKFIL